MVQCIVLYNTNDRLLLNVYTDLCVPAERDAMELVHIMFVRHVGKWSAYMCLSTDYLTAF